MYYNASECVHVDACTDLAAGTFWQGKWTHTVFECDMPAATRLHINYKEICAVVRAVEDWAHSWHGKTVIVHTDSTVTKSVINKGWSRNAYVNRLLRKMAWSCAKLNCKLKAVHVAGAINILPDIISRLHEKGKIHYLIQLLSHWHHGTIPLSHLQDHMSIKAFQFLVARCGQPE